MTKEWCDYCEENSKLNVKLRDKNKRLSKAYNKTRVVYILYKCCECEKEITPDDMRVEVPERNEVYCLECFYKTHDIIK